jgi:rod shape determining protein RodA
MIRILAPVAVLVLAGLLAISSVSLQLFRLQLMWLFVGVAGFMVLGSIDWRSFMHQRWFTAGLYAIAVGLLVAALMGPEIRNIRGWIILGPFSFQPVELAKFALLVVLARFFSRRHILVAHFSTILYSFMYFAIPAGLVALQPDLGSALILFSLWFGLLACAGLPYRRFFLLTAMGVLALFVMWQWFLQPYQKDRILGVFYPERNQLSTNYSVIQSKIAIGSAGFFGKGYGQGTQTQLGFLSEPANDFVFAAFTEEWGWLASVLLIGAFGYLLFQILSIGIAAPGNFEKFFCAGVAIIFGSHFLINTGSATGLFPVIGVTLPFVSYGGSSLLINFLLLGMVNGIRLRS